MSCSRWTASLVVVSFLAGCSDERSVPLDPVDDVFAFANACFTVAEGRHGAFLSRDATGSAYSFGSDGLETATRFFLKPSGLGRYLLFGDARGYLVAEGARLARQTELLSDILLVDDSFESPAEWELEPGDGGGVLARNRSTGSWLGRDGLVADRGAAVPLRLDAAEGCASFPEDDTYTEGEVTRTTFGDGALFGIVDTHSHILANFGFGGGGIFHGAPFHALGIEHALMSCEQFHGREGRRDLFGAGFDAGGNFSLLDFVPALSTGELPSFNHATDGWPTFSTWPSAPFSSTHQTQYYKWIERAYLGGLRLVVQHAVSNQIICDLLGRGEIQPIRYSCNDMVAVDRQIDEIYAMQDYIDAQEGGPGAGWFRVVTSPAEAREVIEGGKLAVILGIETSNLFDCFLTPPDGAARCSEEEVLDRLDAYHARGVRALFPVHKYDNGFSAGDGDKAFIEIGNIVQTGHFSNFVTECEDVPTVFDRRPAAFQGLIMNRDDYLGPPPNDFSDFFIDPLTTLAPFLDLFLEAPDPDIEDHCQPTGLTDLGEFLVSEIMARGMIMEIDHFPRKSYLRAFEMMEENDYPAAGTHGNDNNGRLYQLGGISKTGFGRCRSADRSSTVDDGFQDRIERIRENGGYPAIGFGFDLNGFAGAPGPRLGPNSVCGEPQSDPITHPFTSFAGDVTFSQPRLGERTLDFNTEGLVHIGLLPELLEEVRGDGVTDEELEPLFRSAEAYLRMWEKAEQRGGSLVGRRE